MKKTFTLLTFVFLTSVALSGQCAPDVTPNPSGSRFNMNYTTEAERDAALVGLTSITFPASGGGTVDIAVGDLLTDGPVGGDNVYRIRGVGSFGGVNGDFDGDVVFNYSGSSVTCTYEASMLPVDLVFFDGRKKDHQINLNWKTASENNNEGFVVERGYSTSFGLEWSRLDFVAGSGTTQTSQIYSFVDQKPEEGNNYYRLKQMDYDGQYEYSSVITVKYSRENGSTIGIYPNPVKDQLTLVNGVGKATIYNTLGQPVKHLTIDDNQATIQLSELLNGQYYLQVIQENGTMLTKQFSKMD